MSRLLVARERELEELRQTLAACANGRGALAVLVGEPGIGKTSLADATAGEAAEMGFHVAWGRAWESGGAPAYFPWMQAMGALGLRVPDPSVATAVDGGSARFQLYRAVGDDLRAASAKTPVLIVLDDLHDADIASLRMLEFVARDLRTMRVAILGTHRDAEVRRSRDVEASLARVAREGRTLHLRRLGQDDCVRLAHATSPSIRAELDGAIWQATQGNPLFVSEFARLLGADEGAAREGPLPIPYGVREVIRQRLALLDDPAREVLEVAAVFGVEFHEPSVVAGSGKAAASVSDSLSTAVRFGVLLDLGGRRFRFAHALMRDAIYRDLPRSRAESLHAAAADALEQARPAAPPAGEVAHHAIEAGRVPRLAERVTAAARSLVEAYAYEDAVALLERALEGHGVWAADERGEAGLSLLLARTRMQMGDLPGGRALCVRVAERARALGDEILLATAALTYGAELTAGETDPTMRALLEEALSRLPTGQERLHVRLKARLSAALQPAPDPVAVGDMAVQAVRSARAIGDDETLLDVLHVAGAALSEAVASPERLPMARDAVRLATRLGDRAKLFRGRLRLVFELMEIGDIAEADAEIDAFESAARATGQPRHIWPVAFLRAMRALQEGRFDDADALAEEGAEIAAQTSDFFARVGPFMHRFARLRAQERGPELLAMEPELLAMVSRWNDGETYKHLMAASVRSIAGHRESALDHLARVPLDSTPGRIRISLGNFADTALRAGEAARAAAFYERLLPDAGRWVTYALGGFAAETTYSRLLGGFATILGRHAEAEEHFASALATAEKANARPEIARVLTGHARMCLSRGASGDETRAIQLFARARPIASELSLSRLLATIPADAVAAAEPPRREASPGGRLLAVTAEGETWTVALGPHVVRLKDSRGMGYLARLVAEPGREIHALDLAGAGDGADAGDAGEALDAEARAAYKRRLAELDEELTEAQAWNDGARASRTRAEIEFLSAELSRAVGLGGRPRRVGAAGERARVAVTRRLRDVVRRIAEQSPELGAHVEATVKTGIFCVYRPA